VDLFCNDPQYPSSKIPTLLQLFSLSLKISVYIVSNKPGEIFLRAMENEERQDHAPLCIAELLCSVNNNHLAIQIHRLYIFSRSAGSSHRTNISITMDALPGDLKPQE
jgi:hypothetical protein